MNQDARDAAFEKLGRELGAADTLAQADRELSAKFFLKLAGRSPREQAAFWRGHHVGMTQGVDPSEVVLSDLPVEWMKDADLQAVLLIALDEDPNDQANP